MFNQDGLFQETVSQDEAKLAAQLRKLCNKKGQEQESKLHQSATVLMHLGELYTQKAANAQNPMIQKLCFVKSSALLNAARVRFERKKIPAKQMEVSSLLEKLSESIYDICAITGCQKTLQQISETLFKRILESRQDVGGKLESIPSISKSNNESLAVEKEIITQVTQLYLETTENYMSVMADISKECILLLGNPPCKFCQVGLGSMARKEITLYSDYEHVIVLDNAVDDLAKSEQEKVKEYFRWFAVLFQVIVIGFGETFVRSVGVKSINDLYSDDPAKNWYFDVFTPCGLAFDGMVPHSCMNPLGRQNQTKNRRHKVEFIQTAKTMARYLSSEEHLKNGYYIKDILARTCLAFGDEQVYESFEKASDEIQQSEKILAVANDLASKMSRNVNMYIAGERITLTSEDFDPKRTFYRPITAQLAYLATFFRIKSSSSFEIINELEKVRALNNQELTHKLRYAVGVICKLRMVAYSKIGHQRNEGEQENVLNAVGDYDTSVIYKCLRYLVIAPALIAQEVGDQSTDSPDFVRILQNFNEEFMADATDDIDEMYDSSKYAEAISEIEKQLATSVPLKRQAKLSSILLQCHYNLLEIEEDPEMIAFHIDKIKTIGKSVLDNRELPPGPEMDVYFTLSRIEDDDQETLVLCQKFRWTYRAVRREFARLKDDGIATGIAYSSEVTLRHHETNYLLMLGMELENSKNLYPPRKLYPEIFSMMINEELYAARFMMSFILASLSMNFPFNNFTKISFAIFLIELESHSKELEPYLDTIPKYIRTTQKKKRWSNHLDPNDNKTAAVSLIQSALLHDEEQVPEKIGKSLDICRANLKDDEEFAFIYAYALAAFAFRTFARSNNVKEVKQLKSKAPKAVKNTDLYRITMEQYDEISSKPLSAKASFDKK